MNSLSVSPASARHCRQQQSSFTLTLRSACAMAVSAACAVGAVASVLSAFPLGFFVCLGVGLMSWPAGAVSRGDTARR